MKYEFPSVGQNFRYLQTNRSDVLGNIWSSFNLDFQDNLGALKVANKLVMNTSSADDADLGMPVAFESFDLRWWSICGTKVFKNTDEYATTGFAVDTSTGYQTNYSILYSDLATFNGRLWSTTATDLYSKASNGSGTGAWTNRYTMTANVLHKLAYLKKYNRLYFTNNVATIGSIDTSDATATSGDYSIDLGTLGLNINTMVSSETSIFIGTGVNTGYSASASTTASIFQWDGKSSQVTNEYKLESGSCIAMTVHQNIPYAIDSEGRILKFTGYSFQEIGRLPTSNFPLVGSTFQSTYGKFVNYNGFTSTKNNTLLVGVNNYDYGGKPLENLASGIWEFDLSTKNFTHKHSFTLKTLASSTVTDFGQNVIAGIGAVKVNPLAFGNMTSAGMSTVFAGALIYTDATSTKSAIYINSPYRPTTDNEGQKRGYFVTSWINSDQIVETWNTLWAVHKKYADSTDKMVFKYRLEYAVPTYATITWVNTTSFTTTTDITGYDKSVSGYDGTYGGEVEIVQGTGSGSVSHITNIVNNSGTYTVTIDSAVTGVTTGTARARFQNWVKLTDEVATQLINYGSMPIQKDNTRIQIKGNMQFTGDNEFTKMILQSSTSIQIIN